MKSATVLALCALALLGSSPASLAATQLTVDARSAPSPIETGYLHFGTSVSPSGHKIGINSQYLTLDGKPGCR